MDIDQASMRLLRKLYRVDSMNGEDCVSFVGDFDSFIHMAEWLEHEKLIQGFDRHFESGDIRCFQITQPGRAMVEGKRWDRAKEAANWILTILALVIALGSWLVPR